MNDAFIAHLHDLFADLGALTTRPMFGGHGVYLDAVMVGIVFDETLFLKTNAQTRAAFAAAGGAPFVYRYPERGGTTRAPLTLSYWSVPESAMESAEAMQPWARLSFGAACRKPEPPRRER